MRASQGCMWTCYYPEELRMSSNEKGTSETLKFLAAKTNHVERLHGLEVQNGPKTLSVMTKKDWSSIHGEVKEAESMKSHSSGVGSRMEQNKEGKNSYCSLFPFLLYIYIYCENKRLLNACMIENEMCVFA